MAELLTLARQFIRHNSTSPHGTAELARFVGAHLKKLGFHVRYQRAQLLGAPQANLVARAGPAQGLALLLNTHLDTVSTHPGEWTETDGHPFRATIRRGQLYGLGSADTKLALCCQLIALDALQIRRFKKPLIICGTYGEEIGQIGAKRLIRSGWVKPAYVLNSEPTELGLALGNKGYRVYQLKMRIRAERAGQGYRQTLTFKGKAAHSAVSRHGVNALRQAIKWLDQEEGRVEVISLRGGLAPNIVAPQCELSVWSAQRTLRSLRQFGGTRHVCRPVSWTRIYPESMPIFHALTRQMERFATARESSNLGRVALQSGRLEMIWDHRFAADVNPEIFEEAVCYDEKWGGRVRLIKDNPAFAQKRRGKLFKEVTAALKSLGHRSQTFIKPGCTEAGYFSTLGSEVITIGPGVAYGNVHQPNESIAIRELEKAVSFYKELIRRMCL